MFNLKMNLCFILLLKVVYKNNDVRLELSRLAKQGDPKMKVCTYDSVCK